jgi:uncharacterized protein
MIVLSYLFAAYILDKMREGEKKIKVSLDLGRSESEVLISNGKIIFPDKQALKIKDMEKIADNETVCFAVMKNKPVKIMLFSDETNLMYKLLPTESWPTIELSGIRMHRVKDYNPRQDSEMKIASIKPIRGRVLDTCCGLGYTAILASKDADEVMTHERDKSVLEIAHHNPWSDELFSSKKITINGEVIECVKAYKDNSFDRIIHDPPRVGLSGELYSLEFYKDLYRVLAPGGKMYHYTGAPRKHSGGVDIGGGVMERLKQAGFRHVKRKAYMLGVLAIK